MTSGTMRAKITAEHLERRLGDDVTGEGRTRPDGEREIEVVVLYIDHRVDKLAPLLTRARCVRLDGHSVRAGRHARDFEGAFCTYDCQSRTASEATEAAKQPDVKALRRPARSADDGARHAHWFDRHELDLYRRYRMIERVKEHCLRNIERRRIERLSVHTRRD